MNESENRILNASPLIAALGAILLIIMAVGLAISCGEEPAAESPRETAETRPTVGTARTSRTSTAATTAQAPVSPASPERADQIVSPSEATIWSRIFSRKDPFVQLFSAGVAENSAVTPTGTTQTAIVPSPVTVQPTSPFTPSQAQPVSPPADRTSPRAPAPAPAPAPLPTK